MQAKTPHSDIEALVCYAMAELSQAQSRAVEGHLRKCPECQMELQHLRKSLAPPAAAPSQDSAIAPGLNSLLTAVRTWEIQDKPERSGEALKARVARALGPFLGAKAIDQLLQPVADDGRDLFTNLSPVLALFLGKRAASDLVSHVADTAIMRP